MADVTMPRLSDTMEEGTISRWLKKPGDEIKKGDVIAQIETDKATMDLVAYDAGTLQEILAPEGTTMPIGQAVARLGNGSAPAAAPSGAAPAASAPAAAPEVGEGGSASGEKAAAKEAAPPAAAKAPAQEAVAPAKGPEPSRAQQGPNGTAGRVRASPLARRMAEEHGLELGALAGTGPEGRVIRADVEAAVAGGGKASGQAAAGTGGTPAGGEDETVQLSQMRRTIARRMAESTSTIPHFSLTITVDATELVSLRKQLVAQVEGTDEAAGPKISLNDLVIKAVATALRQVPEVNVSFAGDTLIRRGHVNVGVAVALEGGLIVPVLRDVDQKGVGQISRETRDLVERARAGKLQPADYTGGTFTVSNLGMFGVEQFNAVINPGEAGILAVGAVVREPAEYQGSIALRDRMRLTLSIDHRALDGAGGARYLQALKKLLEHPLLLLV